ncbi:MAG: alcohol dehydrogenase catalytic domain-containing protein [Spirochaetaceae bacterium]|nr:MAG: alcohol dehydrogenase catalytic domain-containing protein [Spirochaetaceae bacterium]
MKQALMIAPGKIEFRDVDKPTIQSDEVLIQIKRIGICGSDIHVYHGMHPYTGYPVVQGHEVSGVIAQVGHSVRGFEPGDPVTIMPQITCGSCYSCRNGNYHICDSLKVMGFQANGAGQEYFAVSFGNVLKIPTEMSLDQGAMVEPTAVAIHALTRAEAGMVDGLRGKKVLVLGAGPIGNLVAQSAKALGAGGVLITDLSEFRLQTAEACGIDYAVIPQQENLEQALLKFFGESRADLTLECVGSEITIGDAVACARKGSTIVIVGVFGTKPTVDLGLVQDRELNILGTLMYQRKDYEKAIELISVGKIKLDPLITDTFPFEDFLKAYRYIERAKDRAIKVMIAL